MRHKDGKEYLDNTPVEIPAGFKRPESIHEMIRRYVRSEEFNRNIASQGFDTEDEANDFDVGDENDPFEQYITRHELSSMAAEELREIVGADQFRQARQQLQENYEKHKMQSRSTKGPDDKGDDNGTRKERSADGNKSVGSGGEVGAATGGKGGTA